MAKNLIEKRVGAGGESVYIAGTRVRVSDIARQYEFALEELIIKQLQHSLGLTFEQVAAAVDYWRENTPEIEAEIREEEAILAKLPPAF